MIELNRVKNLAAGARHSDYREMARRGNPAALLIAFGSFRLLASRMISGHRWRYAKWPRILGTQILVCRAKTSSTDFTAIFNIAPPHFQNTLKPKCPRRIYCALGTRETTSFSHAQSSPIYTYKALQTYLANHKTMVRISLLCNDI
jgi:hypothetical protein